MSRLQLPDGWEEYNDPRGRRYFVTTRPFLQSTWVDPLYPINENDPLPRGWDGRYDISMRWCYFNAHTNTVTYEDPRLLRYGRIERLPRGNIPSKIWFYGEVPPAASVAEDLPAYSPPRPDPPMSSIPNFTNQLPPIQQKPPFNSDITLPSIESLSLPGHQPFRCPIIVGGAEPLSFLRTSGSNLSTSTTTLNRNQRPAQDESQSRSNTPAVTDASDEERPPQSQVQSSGDQPVPKTSVESDKNQRTLSEEDSADVQPVFEISSKSNDNQWTPEFEESADIQPASKSELKNNDDEVLLATCPKNKEFSTASSPLIIKTPMPNQRRRQKRKRQKKYKRQNNDDKDSWATSVKNGDSEAGGSSMLAKDLTPNQSLGEWHKFKNVLEMPVPEAADMSSHSKPTPVSELERNTEPSDPNAHPEPASDISLPRYRLIRAYGDPSGALLYHVLDANCLAEEIAPHYCRLTWNSVGGLHHHAFVDSHPDHVRTSENKLISFHRGLRHLVDADYLIIDFPTRKKHRWAEVNYTDVWADLYRGRIFEDAIRIGRVVKMPCPGGCMIGSISLAHGDRTEVGEEAARVKPLSMTETETRTSAEEAGLFGHEKLLFRGYKKPAVTGSPLLMATRISADEAGLFE